MGFNTAKLLNGETVDIIQQICNLWENAGAKLILLVPQKLQKWHFTKAKAIN